MSSTKTVKLSETFVSHTESEKMKCAFRQQDTTEHNTVYTKTPVSAAIRVSSNICNQSISYNVRDEKSREFYDILNKKLEVKQ